MSQKVDPPLLTGVRLLALANEVEEHRRQQELEEIERQQKVAPKTGALRMTCGSADRLYDRAVPDGYFANLPFS